MRITTFALGLKIFLTLFWFFPLLFFRIDFLESLGMPSPVLPVEFVRLLGAAFLALMVGYILGLTDLIRKKVFPFNTIIVGIVSNGLSCLILLYFGFTKNFDGWRGIGFFAMWGSAFLTGLITALLILGLIAERNYGK